jgi:hypothetical protein
MVLSTKVPCLKEGVMTEILGHSAMFHFIAESVEQVTQQGAHRVQGDPGGEHQQAGHGQHHRDHGIAHGQLEGIDIKFDDIDAQGDARQQGDHARHAKVHQRPVLPDQPQDAVEDNAPLLNGRAFGSIGIADGDGHLCHPQVELLGQELHFRLHAEIVRFELDQVEGAGRKSRKPLWESLT